MLLVAFLVMFVFLFVDMVHSQLCSGGVDEGASFPESSDHFPHSFWTAYLLFPYGIIQGH